jgi:hypothetical protein
VHEAAEKEWDAFRLEREAGIQEIAELRQKVAEEETRQKQERDAMDTDDAPPAAKDSTPAPAGKPEEASHSAAMDVDDSSSKVSKPEPEKSDPEPSDKKEDVEPIQPDDDDAVEY